MQHADLTEDSVHGAPARALQREFVELYSALLTTDASDADACIVRAFRALSKQLDLELLGVIQFDGETNCRGREMHVHGQHPNWGMPPERYQRLSAWLGTEARRGARTVFPAQGQHDTAAAGDLGCLLERGAWRSLLSLPLTTGGACFGFVVFASSDLPEWPISEIAHLQTFCELAASAIGRKFKERDLNRSMRFERLLLSISATFIRASAADLDSELTRALERTTVFLGLDAGMIMSLEPGAGSLVRTHFHARDGVPAPPLRVEGLGKSTLHSLETGEPIVVPCVQDLPPDAAGERDYLRSAEIGALVAIPVKPARHPGGFVSFIVNGREMAWPDAVVQRLRLLGEMFASALARRALETITGHLVEFESLVSGIAARFSGLDSARVEDELEPALETIRTFLDADQCGIFEVFAESREAYLRFRASHPSISSSPKGPNYAESFPYTLEQTCVRGLPSVMSDLEDLPADAVIDRASRAMLGVQSSIDMPIPINGNVRFVLTVAFMRRQWRWTDDYVERVRLLALTLVSSLARARSDMSLRASEQRFRQVVEVSPNGVMLFEPSGRIVMVNHQLEAIFGYSREEVVGLRTRALLPDWQAHQEYERLGKHIPDLPAAETSLRHELRGRRRDGSEIVVEAGLSAIEIDGADYVLANIVDISERKRTEQALQAARDGLGEAQRIARLGSVEWHVADGRWTGSEEARRIFGSAPDDVESPMRYIHPDDQVAVLSEIERVLASKEPHYEFECRVIRADFSEALVRAKGEVTYAAERGHAVHVLGTVQDVTEARAVERELRWLRGKLYHTDRVVRASVLTGSLAHELNQPLAAILSNAQAGLRMIANGAAAATEIVDILNDIVRDDKRAAAVINGLRSMLRQKETERVPLDVAQAIGNLLELLRGEILAAKAELVTEFEPGCVVEADRTQFDQVVLNLVQNAIDAMSHPDIIKRRLTITTRTAREGTVLIAVADSGPGIADTEAKTVFNVFWTTKEQGMGMGLAVCRNIVDSHGGRIWLEPAADGVGARFCVELPMPASKADDESRRQRVGNSGEERA